MQFNPGIGINVPTLSIDNNDVASQIKNLQDQIDTLISAIYVVTEKFKSLQEQIDDQKPITLINKI